MAESNPTHGSGTEGQPYLLTVEQTADLLSIGRTLAHQKTKLFLDSGGVAVDGIPAVRIGRAKRVPRVRLLEWIDRGCMNIPSATARTSWLGAGARTTTALLVRKARGATSHRPSSHRCSQPCEVCGDSATRITVLKTARCCSDHDAAVKFVTRSLTSGIASCRPVAGCAAPCAAASAPSRGSCCDG